MPKYPEVAALFADLFADEFGVVDTETRKALAAGAMRSNATISRWIGGDARPETNTWNAIAAVAGVSVQEVVAALTSESFIEDALARSRQEGAAAHAYAPASDLTQLRADLGRLARKVDALAQVVHEELGIELANLLDDEQSPATPDETGPDGVARPAP